MHKFECHKESQWKKKTCKENTFVGTMAKACNLLSTNTKMFLTVS